MRWSAIAPAVATALATMALAGCVGTGAADPASAPAGVDIAAARAALDALAVKGRAPRSGYERGCRPGQGCVFGPAWSDDVGAAGGHNGCDTRNDILRRDLHDVITKPDGCVVVSGVLEDAYTGDTITFQRGPNSDDVQIDHVVALSDAWQTGAQTWSAEQRRDFANDPDNLQAVSGPANQRKGDADAASWLPRAEYQCTYAARQVGVKSRYGLWVTPAERGALERILNAC